MNIATGKPRLLLITRNFPPLWGGMERLNWHIADELAREYEVTVVGPAGAAAHAPVGVRVIEVPLRPLWRFLLLASWRALRAARWSRPTVVLAGSGLTAPLAWLAARFSGARAAAYVHGLDLTVPHPAYRALWRPALRRMHCVIANSRATATQAQAIGIAPERIHIVHPGVDMPAHDSTARARFRATHDLGEHAPVLLSVGRLTMRKGLREFVSQVLPRIAAQRPDVQLVVVGDAPADALYAQAQSPASIQAAADAAGVGTQVHFLGTRFGAELADAYAGADLHVFPVRELRNDPEGFGMVAVEAAAHGLPTVAYATGGVVDAVGDGISGRLVAAGDGAGFARATLQSLDEPLDPAAVRAFAAHFAWLQFGKHLLQSLPSKRTNTP
ncbi:glycosyltransferase family 4 protein [Metallibacterium sp.]